MKKRALLTILFVIAFSLLAVLSVSAAEYELVDDLGTPSWYTGNYEYMTDKTSQVVLVDSDGNYTAYPAYYILKYSISVSGGNVTAAYISGFDYSFVNEKTGRTAAGKEYTAGSIYKIELPEGLTTIKASTLGYKTTELNIVEIVFSDTITTIESHAFRGTTNLKKVVFSKNLTKIGESAFQDAKGLEEFVLPAGSEEYLDISEANIFYGCSSLKEADFSTRNIRKIGSACLSKCTALGKVTLPDTVEEIGAYFLFECYNAYLASDFLPTSLKKVGFQFLSGCATVSNRVIYFPEGFTGGEGAFDSTYILATERYKTTNTTLVFLGKITGTIALEQFNPNTGRKITLVFTKNDFSDLAGKFVYAATDGTKAFIANTADTSDTDYFVKEGTLNVKIGNSSDSHSKYKVDENGNTLYYVNDNCARFYFCGGDDVEVCYSIRGNKVNNTWGSYITTPFAFDKAAHDAEENGHMDLSKVISYANCGVDGVVENTCVICDRVARAIDPATGNHTLSQISPCADKCSVCFNYVQRAEQSHDLNVIIEYKSGYDNKGEKLTTCKNEGCEHCVSELTNALFVLNGFSNSANGIMYNYIVNQEAISEYKTYGGTIYFGVVVAIGDVTAPLNADGSLAEGTPGYASDLTERGNDLYEIAIKGIPAESIATKLVCCGYICDGENVYYMGATSLEETSTPVTLEALIALTPAETKEEY